MTEDTIKTLFFTKQIYLVDVREPDEWDSGHIEGAISAPMSTLMHPESIQKLPKDRPLYLYCSRGNRAKLAKEILKPFFTHIEAITFNFSDLQKIWGQA